MLSLLHQEDRRQLDAVEVRKTIVERFATVYKEMLEAEPPMLQDDTVLLETGLDSLGFTILVSSGDITRSCGSAA